MLHIAQVEISIQEYEIGGVGDKKLKTINHTVEANSEEEAREKIKEHYNDKTSSYCIYYEVCSIEFFEHIL